MDFGFLELKLYIFLQHTIIQTFKFKHMLIVP